MIDSLIGVEGLAPAALAVRDLDCLRALDDCRMHRGGSQVLSVI